MTTKRQGSSQEHARPRATARAATTGSTAGRIPAPSWRPTPDVTAPAATATKTLATVLRRARAPMDSHTTATPGKPARTAGTPAPSSRTRQAATAQAAACAEPRLEEIAMRTSYHHTLADCSPHLLPRSSYRSCRSTRQASRCRRCAALARSGTRAQTSAKSSVMRLADSTSCRFFTCRRPSEDCGRRLSKVFLSLWS